MQFQSKNGLISKDDENATREAEIDPDDENDAMARARKNAEISKGIKEGKLDPSVYRGLNGYANYFD